METFVAAAIAVADVLPGLLAAFFALPATFGTQTLPEYAALSTIIVTGVALAYSRNDWVVQRGYNKLANVSGPINRFRAWWGHMGSRSLRLFAGVMLWLACGMLLGNLFFYAFAAAEAWLAVLATVLLVGYFSWVKYRRKNILPDITPGTDKEAKAARELIVTSLVMVATGLAVSAFLSAAALKTVALLTFWGWLLYLLDYVIRLASGSEAQEGFYRRAMDWLVLSLALSAAVKILWAA